MVVAAVVIVMVMLIRTETVVVTMVLDTDVAHEADPQRYLPQGE